MNVIPFLQVKLAEPGNPTYLRVFSYCVVFIPSLLVCSGYPLGIHAMVNNIYTVLTGHDTSIRQSNRCYRLLLLVLRFSGAVIPILCAFGVSNLVVVFQYGGIFSFAIIIFFPVVLQLQSIRVCKKTFRCIHVRMRMANASGEDSCSGDDTGATNNTQVVIHSLQLTQPQNESSLYMTPYSSKVFSHPIAVSIIGAIGGLLFLLSIASLFIQPELCGNQSSVEMFVLSNRSLNT